MSPEATPSKPQVADNIRRLLFIIVDFAPLGSAQILRWTNILRYLAEQGHTITVLTAEYPGCDVPMDHSQLEVIDHPNIEVEHIPLPYCNPSRMKIIEWGRKTYRRAVERIKQQPYDAVLTSCLPIYAHFIGSALRRNGHVPLWLADYGDPWSTARTLGQGPLKKAVEQVLEREVIRPADGLTITTEKAMSAFLPLYNHPERIFVVPGGASYFHLNTDWTQPPRTLQEGDTLKILYPGSFYRNRGPETIFQGLAQVDHIHLKIVGKHRMDVPGMAAEQGVTDAVTLLPYSEQRSIVEMQHDSDVLLLTNWPVPEQLSGKIYEYLRTNKPIFYITDHDPKEDVALHLLQEHGTHYVCRHEPDAIAATLRQIYDDARAGKLPEATPNLSTGFDRRAQQVSEALAQLTPK